MQAIVSPTDQYTESNKLKYADENLQLKRIDIALKELQKRLFDGDWHALSIEQLNKRYKVSTYFLRALVNLGCIETNGKPTNSRQIKYRKCGKIYSTSAYAIRQEQKNIFQNSGSKKKVDADKEPKTKKLSGLLSKEINDSFNKMRAENGIPYNYPAEGIFAQRVIDKVDETFDRQAERENNKEWCKKTKEEISNAEYAANISATLTEKVTEAYNETEKKRMQYVILELQDNPDQKIFVTEEEAMESLNENGEVGKKYVIVRVAKVVTPEVKMTVTNTL